MPPELLERDMNRERRYRKTSLTSKSCSHSSWVKPLAALSPWTCGAAAAEPGIVRGADTSLGLDGSAIVGLNSGIAGSASGFVEFFNASFADSGIDGRPA